MSVLLVLAGLALRVVFVVAIFVSLAFTVWVVWDCTAGPSARLAAEARARSRQGVDGW